MSSASTSASAITTLEGLAKEPQFAALCNNFKQASGTPAMFAMFFNFDEHKKRLNQSDQDRLDKWLTSENPTVDPDWLKGAVVQQVNASQFTPQEAKGLSGLAKLFPTKVCPDCHQAVQVGTKCIETLMYHHP
jgi:hypothetical protein